MHTTIVIQSHPLEIAWLLIALGGWVAAWLSKLDARDDRTRTEFSKNPQERFMHHVIHISARFMLAVHTTIVAAAVWAQFNPPPPPSLTDTQSLESIVCWMIVSVLLTVHGWLGRHWRARINRGFDDRSTKSDEPQPSFDRREDGHSRRDEGGA